ncbi:MAG: hypothetical protein NTU73_03545 [Ignavibacteriae bacterium]|nr:hypothetical protein [Ignavibacteriota bacterium]
MKDEHPTVQMERETIDMNIYEEYYDVIAQFTFKNNGDACTVYMGFPESGSGDLNGNWDTTSAFLSFSTSVDGVNVTAKRECVRGDDEYHAYWIKQVSFKKNETKKIVVKYRSPLGGGISAYYNGVDYYVSYTFSGGNWYGKVLESKTNIYFHIPVEIRPNEKVKIKKELDHYTYYRTNWEAEENFGITFKIKEKGDF